MSSLIKVVFLKHQRELWARKLYLIHNCKGSVIRRYLSTSFIMTAKTDIRDHLRPLVAVCQMTSHADKEANFEVCKSLVARAGSRGAQMVFLPECFDHIGEKKEHALEMSEQVEGPLIQRYKNLAKEFNIWLSLGGFHQRGPESDLKRVQNAHIIISNDGKIVEIYHKTHLFSVHLPGIISIRESDYTIPGEKLVPPVDSPIGKIGLGICYDLRFPEFSLSLAKSGAEILTYPSAFTQTTGLAHWESLLRSRAIETQCYVIAAAQTGKHNPKRSSYGHAMIIDPWGCVVACCHEGTDVAFAEVDLDYLRKVRQEMPVWTHRRTDLYGELTDGIKSNDIDASSHYQFGPVMLLPSQLFYRTQLSMAFVNKKPVLPGHVLIAPLRPAERLKDLTGPEISDLFTCVQKVQGVIEEVHGVQSSTIAVQDGPEAGQTINHLHVHVLPRKAEDIKNNDDIYLKLEGHEFNVTLDARNEDGMSQEATLLRKYFY
ncbi:ntrilase and fragile histidine triad fusion protein NitFhit isoform X2 [Tachypleus tridentatus]|uniref:ntrilase and fragile histidine triad fusion protein NitFhit isoform X2 n=1 Tax=Tachypleus tridentatus TaxID=6853 RepID=UPI003FD6BF3C